MIVIDLVVEQTREVASRVTDADPQAPVPTCPGWSLRDLVGHIGATQRWVTQLISDQTTDPMAAFSIPWATAPEDTKRWPGWLEEGADIAAATIRQTPAGSALFDPGQTGDGLAFWSRRLFGEISVHRLDVALSLAQPYTLAPDLASEAIDEWLSNLTSPGWAANVPGFAESMRGSGETIQWSSRDTGRRWLVRRTDAPLELTRASTAVESEQFGADQTVLIEGDSVTLLGVLSRRSPLDAARGCSVSGDRIELDHFLDHMVWIGAN